MIMIDALTVVAFLLMLGSLAWVCLPADLWRLLAAHARAIPRREACALALILAAGTWYGADKGHVSRSARVAQLLTVLASGELRGPTNVVASAIAGAAVQGVLSETSGMYAAVSQAVDWCWAEIPDLEWAITNTSIAYIQCEIPAPLNLPNPVARADMLQVVPGNDGIRHVMVAFSAAPATAPLVSFWADDLLCEPVSNSFPATVEVTTPGGASQCYVYTVRVPDDMRDIVLLPDREMRFGGGPANEPLSVLGAVMVNERIGLSGERLIGPGVVGVFGGGILVEVRDE